MINISNLHSYKKSLAEVEAELSAPEAFASANARELFAEQTQLRGKIELYEQYESTQKQLEDARAMLADPEMAELAKEEVPQLEASLTAIEEQIKIASVSSDPNDAKNAIIEIRGGAGGDESSLFAAELARMYTRYAEALGLKMEVLNSSPTEAGGYKEIIFEVSGNDAYGNLKYESGVHRVQRVPATESAGRIHTSTVTVAVLPEAEESDLVIEPKDLRIDVYRSSGNGGQSVNTTDSAVRITHLPTGIVVTCQDEKSQLKNKAKALSVLRSRLLAQKQEAERSAQGAARLSQIGTGDRSEKIRTYNFPQDRLTDHRINFTSRNLSRFLDGDIGPLVQALAAADLEAKLKSSENL